MKSMRTSFQLFSSDVQQHLNLISEQLEEINRRRTVIPHVADKYDPDHPDADWGGYVRRSYKKRYYTNQSGKLFEPQQNPSDEQAPGIPFQSAVYQVGPGSNVSANDWKTSYASQTSMEATPKETFVLGTRQNAQHKRHVTPMYERGQQSSARSQSPSSPWSSRQGSPSLSGSGSSGSLSGRRIDSRRSLLAGIGKLVAAEDLNDLHPPPERHLPESYTSAASKTLLAEN
ncbi:uncharacterized protein PITG_00934 [Phytophthora infestans T30-4]|uniref:Uncharacterized protein n=1 Tax=Phytophthora infestans (strain T30-4) TaxID=403677 RepID=D0MS19_PHYIT|nr:uncharacterized protein PITG_00934 [Phytophthora infestans T30-4]EEY58288.1 hypothetical protein PITG_00934 [Phytophthora infestans T30-4]|eukprot:XP_002909474.1 hypothetical protein PITG_00934 [Phytophthora infestans T30-4]